MHIYLSDWQQVSLRSDIRHCIPANFRWEIELPITSSNDLSVEKRYVLVTKDSEFASSHLLHGRPYKLLLISTGNISNKQLKELFLNYHQTIVSLLELHFLVEMTANSIVVHS